MRTITLSGQEFPNSQLIECRVLANTPDDVINQAIESFRSELLKGGQAAWDTLMHFDQCTTRQYLLGLGPSISPVLGCAANLLLQATSTYRLRIHREFLILHLSRSSHITGRQSIGWRPSMGKVLISDSKTLS